ncbi:MAG: iron-containing alcohol dehydrogenase, partial [Armatimonadota bacterium]
ADLRGHLPDDAPLFAEVEPNPTVQMVDALVDLIDAHDADVLVAAGGGSSLDCAKAAASVSQQGGSARKYHSEDGELDERHLPLIAIPTTAGTGSEVTPISVLGDPEKSVKAPLVHDNFFPAVALVDPALTMSMPPAVTASTGFDALAHAVEGYWSKNHNPISDALALEAVRLVFEHLPDALEDGSDTEAREGMSLAALLGGMAFQAPKNAAVHACSFPFSAKYHLPHGTACALTLDHFMRFNAPAMGERAHRLAAAGGFESMEEMADAFAAMKAASELPTRLSEFGVTEADIEEIVAGSFHPLMDNNPREVTPEDLAGIYRQML